MANVAIADLVHHSRFSNDNIIALILYIPIGLIFFIARTVIGIQLWLISTILPDIASVRQMITNFACLTLGTISKPKGKRDESVKMLVSNHLSIFDPMALFMTAGCITPCKWDLPPTLISALGLLGLSRTTSHDELRTLIRRHYHESRSDSLAFQPEELPTNGRALLQFKHWPFSIADKVQPVAIEVSRWFGNVTTNTSACLWTESVPWSDILWYLFNPCTFYTVNWLPIIERIDNETDRNFANRVQKAIADFLKIEATEVTCDQVRDCVQAREAESLARPINTPLPSSLLQSGVLTQRPELQRMASQVKEVLPAVPISIILKELARTRCVDVTITNILEGSVVYTPETAVSLVTDSAPGPSTSHPAKLSIFAKNAQERQMSFQERKAQMIETAKSRYIEKHGLNVA